MGAKPGVTLENMPQSEVTREWPWARQSALVSQGQGGSTGWDGGGLTTVSPLLHSSCACSIVCFWRGWGTDRCQRSPAPLIAARWPRFTSEETGREGQALTRGPQHQC